MKLSVYAQKLGITYKTAWRLWKNGNLDAYQLPTGTVIVDIQEGELLQKAIRKKKKNETNS